jgi:hypothetical protein
VTLEIDRNELTAINRTIGYLGRVWYTMPFGLERSDLDITLEVLRRILDEATDPGQITIDDAIEDAKPEEAPE